MDQAHLVVGMHQVMVRLGGTARRWRVDRMATVIVPGSDQVQASFAPVAKHYGVGVDPCPPRRGNRKGVVEKMIDYLTQSWWRTARDRFICTKHKRRWIGGVSRSPTSASATPTTRQ